MPNPRRRPDHYFSPAPAVPSERQTVALRLPDLSLDLASDRGVFAGAAVDAGTKLLLAEAPPPPESGDVLDLGCGYGPIAVTLARRSPAATIWAVDVNERAVALTLADALIEKFGGDSIAELQASVENWTASVAERLQAPKPRT